MHPQALRIFFLLLLVMLVLPGAVVVGCAISRWRGEGKPSWGRLLVLYGYYWGLLALNLTIAMVPLMIYLVILEPRGMRSSKAWFELATKVTFWILLGIMCGKASAAEGRKLPASREAIEHPGVAVQQSLAWWIPIYELPSRCAVAIRSFRIAGFVTVYAAVRLLASN